MERVPDYVMQQFIEENKELRESREKDLQEHLSAVSKIKDEIKNLKSKLAAVQQLFSTEYAARISALEQKEKEVESLKDKAKQMLQNAGEKEKKIETISNAIEAADKKSRERQEQEKGKIESIKKSLLRDMANLEQKEAEIKEKMELLTKATEETDGLFKNAIAKTEAAEKFAEILNAKMKTTEEMIVSLKSVKQENSRLKQGYEAKIKACDSLISEEQDKIEKLNAGIVEADALKNKVSKEREDVSKEKASFKEWEVRLQNKETDISEREQLLKKEKQEIDKKIATLEKLRKE